MVVHRKDFKKQYVKIEKVCFPYERPFLQKKERSFLLERVLKIASIGLHKEAVTKLNLKLEKTTFLYPFIDMKLS